MGKIKQIRRWLDDEVIDMRRLHDQGEKIPEIAECLGRTKASVRQKLYEMGIFGSVTVGTPARPGRRVSIPPGAKPLSVRKVQPGMVILATVDDRPSVVLEAKKVVEGGVSMYEVSLSRLVYSEFTERQEAVDYKDLFDPCHTVYQVKDENQKAN